MPQVTFTFTSADGIDITNELLEFAGFIGLDIIAPGRYSMFLVSSLWHGYRTRRLDPYRVTNQIRSLECNNQASQLKAPSRFKYKPLKGLWHKHYLPNSVSSYAANIRRAIFKHGIPVLDEMARAASESKKCKCISDEDINKISYDAVHGSWRRLSESQTLTGEWVVYAIHEERNYYLCIGTHDKREHATLRKYIDAICCVEFPFLTTILT